MLNNLKKLIEVISSHFESKSGQNWRFRRTMPEPHPWNEHNGLFQKDEQKGNWTESLPQPWLLEYHIVVILVYINFGESWMTDHGRGWQCKRPWWGLKRVVLDIFPLKNAVICGHAWLNMIMVLGLDEFWAVFWFLISFLMIKSLLIVMIWSWLSKFQGFS